MGVDPNGYQFCFAEQTAHVVDGPRCMGGGSTTGGWGPSGNEDLIVTVEIGTSIFSDGYIGVAFVFNFTDHYFERYNVVGVCVGCKVSLNVGFVDNYVNPGDFEGEFLAGSITNSYGFGIGHSWSRKRDKIWNLYDPNKPRSFNINLSSPGATGSYTYYGYDKDSLTYWGE